MDWYLVGIGKNNYFHGKVILNAFATYGFTEKQHFAHVLHVRFNHKITEHFTVLKASV